MNLPKIKYLSHPSQGIEEMNLHPKIDNYIKQFAGADYYYEVMYRGSVTGVSSVNIKRFSKDLVNQVLILEEEVNL